jgi:hypothetical protein
LTLYSPVCPRTLNLKFTLAKKSDRRQPSELADDPKVQQLAEETVVENLASELKKKLPEE